MNIDIIVNKLDSAILNLNALSKVLENEYQLLRIKDSAAIESLSKQKLAMISQLESVIDSQDNKPISLDRYVYKHSNINIATLPKKQQISLRNKWQRLLNDIETCHSINQRNGQFINLAQQSIHSALSILRGQSEASGPYGYNQDGNKSSPLPPKTIAKA